MSQIKISQLPAIPRINANTQLTVFAGVDLANDTTGQISAQTLANYLYANTNLAVGPYGITLTNTVAQFSNSDPNFIQVNLQNPNSTGSADYIVTADQGGQNFGYIDLGINNSGWNSVTAQQTSQYPFDGYLVTQGDGTYLSNLVIGTGTAGGNVVFAVGGYFANNVVAKLTSNGLVLNTQSYIVFGDGTKQSTAGPTNAYTQAAFALANTAVQNTSNIILPGNVSIAGAFTTTGNSTFNGNVTANGTTTLNGNVLFVGPTTHQGDIITYGNLITTGAMTTTGNVVFNGLFTNNGNTINNGNTFNNGVTTLNGLLYVNGSVLPANTTISLGSATQPFGNIYTSNSNVVLGNTNLSISGSIMSNGAVVIQDGSYNQNVGALEIVASANFATVVPAANGTMVHVTGLDSVSTKVLVDNFGPGNTYPLFVGRAGRGTAGSPTATQSGDVIARYSGSSYGGANTTFLSTGSGRMDITAIENHSDTNRGTMISFGMAAVGSNTITSNVVNITTSTVTISPNTALNVANTTTTNEVIANTIVYGSATANSGVTQLTSRTTSVTANGISGTIIGYSGSALMHQTGYVFTIYNSSVLHTTDIVMVSVQNSNCPLPQVTVANTRVGSFDVAVFNAAGAGNDASYTMNINFGIIRVGN